MVATSAAATLAFFRSEQAGVGQDGVVAARLA